MVTVTRARLRADRRPWAQARSLPDLGELMAQWLEGTILHQPGYGDPEPGEQPGPEPETTRIAPLLAACCRAGYVTTQSQPGTTDWTTGTPDQRAAVEGFCDAATWARLGPAADAAGLLVIAHDPANLPRWRWRKNGATVVTLDQGLPFTRFGIQRPAAHLRDFVTGYGECHRDAVRAVLGAWQVTLIERDWGRNEVLWPVLERFAGISP